MASQNRYSMPVTKSRNGIQDMLSLDQTNTTRFLFGDEDAGGPMDSKNYLQMHATDENFPILVRGEHPQNVSPQIDLPLQTVLTASCSYPPHPLPLTWHLANPPPRNLLAGHRLAATGLANRASLPTI